ncbi:monomeric sarcosine oxidase [Abditibacteriota bacterium]|nr:monomeric sarcosine oxidase [Abditibacteriota bacterium]
MNCDVLVIGGGLMGCATAFDIAKRGCSVVVAERGAAPGQETTAKSGAIIRAHYGVPELVTMALEANKRFQNFEELFGGDAGFRQSGYAVLVDEQDANTLKLNVAMQRALGVEVELLSPDEFKAMAPSVKIDDVALVAYEKNGGYASPSQTVNSLVEGATKKGARFLYRAPVLDAVARGDGWQISLGDGTSLSCGQIVICTGNWSRSVGELFDLELPVVPMRAQIVVVERPTSFTGDFPVVSDLINLAYFRSEGERGMWVGSSDSADLKDFQSIPLRGGAIKHCPDADPGAINAAKNKAALRFEGIDALDKGGVQRAFCGLYETTPDWQPIIDSFETVHIAVGFSGHGFKLATVMGEEMGCRVEGENSPFPTQIFDLARFADKRPVASQWKYERAKFLR